MAADSVLLVIVAVVALGVGAQLIASKYRVPSVLFLVLAGLAIGPEGAGLVSPGFVTDAVVPVVGASVAVIVFQDAFSLDFDSFRDVSTSTLRLVTLGAVLSLVGTAFVIHAVLGTAWGVALLVGALVIATGPTVLVPILDVIDAPERVSTLLRTEGLVNDVTAAIVSVAIFEAVTLQETDLVSFAEALLVRLGIGLLVGAVVAGGVWYVLTKVDFSPRNAIQNARLLVFAGALVAYGGAEIVAGEAGIAAAATAGLLVGNRDPPYKEEILGFEDDVSALMLSFVFITLTALVRFDTLATLGVAGLVVVGVVVLVVRPLVVFLSTFGVDFSVREKVFMSVVAPRGILTAGIATLFSLRLRASNPEAAATIVGMVFLIILTTSALEGGIARHAASLLGLEPRPVIIVGGDEFGRSLARRYEHGNRRVEVVEDDPELVQRGRAEDLRVHQGDGTDPSVLQSRGAARADLVIAATDDDRVNHRIAHVARTAFGADTIARVNDPENVSTFEELGVRTLPPSLSALESPTRERDADWLTVLSREDEIREVELVPREPGRTVREHEADLPERSFVAAVRRRGEIVPPDEDLTVEPSDRLLVVGRDDAIEDLLAQYGSAD